jgi:glutamine cyclotransferase
MRRTAVLLLVLSLLLNVPAALLQNTVIEKLVPDVLADFPHDPGAFTQGILFHDGLLYESTGQYGQSSLRQVDPETGEVLLTLPLPDEIFAEGLALVDETYLYQITWREQVALRFNLSAFTEGEALDFMPFEYEGQGWGLCYDGELLVMSNGSDTLALRDPETFEVVEEIVITFEDVPLSQLAYDGQWITEAPPIPDPDSTPQPIRAKRADLLNELECVGDSCVGASVRSWRSVSAMALASAHQDHHELHRALHQAHEAGLHGRQAGQHDHQSGDQGYREADGKQVQ